MLTKLSVRNLAIIESASVSFGLGLNVITGETGAGKSVLMGALRLAVGGRADKSAIREGAQDASVEALFQLDDSACADEVLASAGLPLCEEGVLLIRRILNVSGAGRCFINDSPATVQTLRRLGEKLVDIHGPNDHQSLLEDDFQRDLLDAYGEYSAVLNDYSSAWQRLREVRAQMDALSADPAGQEREADLLQFSVDEISAAALTDADEEDLVARHAQAANAEQILSLGGASLQMLMEGGGSVFDQLVSVQNQLTELARILPEAAQWKKDAQSTAVAVQELAGSMNESLSQMDADPAVLEQLEARMALVQRLKRKYGRSVAEILETERRDRTRLQSILNRSEEIEKLQKAVDAAQQEAATCAAALTDLRKKAAKRLSAAVTSELRDLGFLQSALEIEIYPSALSAHGADEVAFFFAPNPGEPLRALKAIASSGEIARVMLAVKSVLSAHDQTPVLVFDEIDSNIGGEVGRAVGKKLRRVAKSHQVICITHLPQSAVYGEYHFRVEKRVVEGRTHSGVTPLDFQQRTEEIARMLGGKGVTSVVEKHAKELLLSAEQDVTGKVL